MPQRSKRVKAGKQTPGIGLRAPVQVLAAAGGEGERRRFRLTAYTGEPLRLWNFELPVVIDCATVDMSAQMLPAVLDHMAYADCIVGQVDAVRIEGAGLTPPLVAEGYFTPIDQERDAAAFVLAKADAGFIWQVSVGGDPTRLERVEAGQTVAVNGREYPGPILVARGVVLRELSFTVLGADRRTNAVLARRIRGSAMTFEEWLVSLGFDTEAQTSLTEIQLANLQKMYNEAMAEDGEETTEGEGTTPPPPTNAAEDGTATDPATPPPTNAAARRPVVQATGTADPVVQHRRAIAAEDARIASVRRVCASAQDTEITVSGRRVNLMAHAIAEGWSVDRTELEMLRASRPTGPAIHSRSRERDCTLQALEGAMILRAGGRLDHPSYQSPRAIQAGIPGWLRSPINDAARNRIMEASHRYSDLSAVDLCREALRIEGRDAPHGRTEMIRAAFSSSALTNVFTTNVNAILLSTYLESPDSTVGWVREQDVADFKTQERPRMAKSSGLQKLPRGGEADHLSRSDVGESYRIARYAKQFVVDEQDIIDDSLGALADTPQEMGLAAARLRPDLVYAIILANPTLTATARALFNATDGNLDTNSALAAGTLRAAVSAMALFQENGVNLNLKPTHLIVPPSLRHLAHELVNSSQILIARGGTTDTTVERGSSNALLADGLTPVSDARLENGVIDPSSGTTYAGLGTAWYLACALAHTIEVGYLRGTGRAPRVRSFTLERGQYGLGWDVSMDIGAKALDWRGLHKATA